MKLTIMEEIATYGMERINDAKILTELTGAKEGYVDLLMIQYGGVKDACDNARLHKDLFTPRQIEKFELISELMNRSTSFVKNNRVVLSSPHSVYERVLSDIKHFEEERFYVLLLNTKNELIERVEVSKGIINASIVHPREVFKEAIRQNANSVILAHNHPSGNPKPSSADLEVTERIVEAGKIIGIKVIDHIVVGKQGFISFREEKHM